ncbi:ATPase associated with various cellular activities, AAA_3 [Methanococcus maripaludis C5]|uniref:ATPase associated with various cellular activities, AAA_3 n=1 Tax=Methanococcus maripaludis (strain C5 / ATCC BAA-1333) TaxID=402880 RepID=A4FZI7_METM5|nr:MoxR family ATPase [Methanococcus maripaludis]ABO35621.1 ATPase associated with various cellular activities, AAA_3 [Methanococcus maripaludis C5]
MEGKEFLKKVEKEMEKCIVGKEDIIKLLLVSLLSRGHVVLEGIPGLAKTTIVKNFAKVFGLKFSRVQLTPDTMPSDIIGVYYYSEKTKDFEIKKGPIFTNILLADEINRTPPKTQSAMLESMQENQATIEGNSLKLPDPFILMATMNPLESEGVYALPEAQMDRFMFKIKLEYPKKNEEIEMLKKKYECSFETVCPVISHLDLENAFEKVNNVHITEEILHYIYDLVQKTRIDERFIYGASPRASEQFLYASRAVAYLNGRDYVLPDDVKEIAKYILRHKVKLKIDYEFEGMNNEDIIDEIISNTDIIN